MPKQNPKMIELQTQMKPAATKDQAPHQPANPLKQQKTNKLNMCFFVLGEQKQNKAKQNVLIFTIIVV